MDEEEPDPRRTARIDTPDAVKRASATLRKRFERIELRLRELSKDLLPEE